MEIDYRPFFPREISVNDSIDPESTSTKKKVNQITQKIVQMGKGAQIPKKDTEEVY